MFYCEPCRVERNWPDSMARSYGRCEICGKTGACNDRASSTLPLPPQPPKETMDDILVRISKRLEKLNKKD